MTPEVIESIGAFIGVSLFGGFTLAGFKMWLSYKTERLKAQGGGSNDGLKESVDELRDHLFLARDEIAELRDRMDFAERLLAQDSPGGKLLERPNETPV